MDLSNCPQITSAILLLSLTPASYPTDPVRKEIIEQFFISSGHPIRDKYELPQKLLETFIFEAVQEVDISKCRRLFIEHAVDCLSQSFPSLRILKAAFLLNIRTTGFFQLLEKCSLVGEIDLTVDVTPLIPASVTVLSSNPAMIPPELEKTSSLKYQAVQTMPFHFHEPKPLISNVTKLTLEGRTDVSGRIFSWCNKFMLNLNNFVYIFISLLTTSNFFILSMADLSLQYISKYFVLLCHLNIKGCISVTDIGISDLIRRCKKLNSIVVCDTSFGINSVQALCSATSDGGNFPCMHSSEKHLNSVVSNLQALHMGGCIGKLCFSLLICLAELPK